MRKKHIQNYLTVFAVALLAVSSSASAGWWPWGKSVDEKAREAFNGEKWEKAVSLYTKAIDKKGHQYAFYFNRGKALAEMGRNQEAIQDLDQAEALIPANAVDVAAVRAMEYYEVGKYDKALEDCETVIEKDAASGPHLVLKGIISYKDGNFKEAARLLIAAEDYVASSSEEGLQRAKFLSGALFTLKKYVKAKDIFFSQYFNLKAEEALSEEDYYTAGALFHVTLNEEKAKKYWDKLSDEYKREKGLK